MVILRAYLNFPIKPCYTVSGIKLCILYISRSRDDVHIVSTEMVRNVQGHAQIHNVHGISL